jgi:FAD/FMN-containing dehydrogenase
MFSPFRTVEKELRRQISGDAWFDVEKRTEYSTATEAGRERIERARQEVFDLIIKLDGVLSAEQGDGFVRTPFLEQAFGSEVYGIFKEIKQTLDPQDIFNPQKIVGRQDRVFLHDLKYA